MTFEDKKSYYVGRCLTESSDPAKALAVINEALADETLNDSERMEIIREINRLIQRETTH